MSHILSMITNRREEALCALDLFKSFIMVGYAAEDCDKPNVITADRDNNNSNPLASAYVFSFLFLTH